MMPPGRSPARHAASHRAGHDAPQGAPQPGMPPATGPGMMPPGRSPARHAASHRAGHDAPQGAPQPGMPPGSQRPMGMGLGAPAFGQQSSPFDGLMVMDADMTGTAQLDAIARALGISAAALTAALREGYIVAQLADERGTKDEDVVAAATSLQRQVLDNAVAAGRITKRRADLERELLTAWTRLRLTLPGNAPGGFLYGNEATGRSKPEGAPPGTQPGLAPPLPGISPVPPSQGSGRRGGDFPAPQAPGYRPPNY
jgi:hypothetical protein